MKRVLYWNQSAFDQLDETRRIFRFYRVVDRDGVRWLRAAKTSASRRNRAIRSGRSASPSGKLDSCAVEVEGIEDCHFFRVGGFVVRRVVGQRFRAIDSRETVMLSCEDVQAGLGSRHRRPVPIRDLRNFPDSHHWISRRWGLTVEEHRKAHNDRTVIPIVRRIRISLSNALSDCCSIRGRSSRLSQQVPRSLSPRPLTSLTEFGPVK